MALAGLEAGLAIMAKLTFAPLALALGLYLLVRRVACAPARRSRFSSRICRAVRPGGGDHGRGVAGPGDADRRAGHRVVRSPYG
jgi:hypothetical protein